MDGYLVSTHLVYPTSMSLYYLSLSIYLRYTFLYSPYVLLHLHLSIFFHSLACHVLQSDCAGVAVNSRVSSKIQQLLNTLKRPKRPPLREFFVDDFEELLDGESAWMSCVSFVVILLSELKIEYFTAPLACTTPHKSTTNGHFWISSCYFASAVSWDHQVC